MSGAVPHVYGAAEFSPDRKFETLEEAQAVLDIVEKAGIRHLDTAQLYGESEATLGALNAGDRFTIDTKTMGGLIPGALKYDELIRRVRTSLQKLGVTQINTLYIHMPDATVPIDETLAAIQALYEERAFRRFGLSNYLAPDVQQIYDHCVQHDYVRPSVYQGHHNAVARRAETELLPLLRRLGIAFYAYGPMAGGFLARSRDKVLEGTGRFDPSTTGGRILRGLYCRPALLDCLEEWADIAAAAGCSGAELACRWVKFHGALRVECGDAVVFSSTTLEQTKETLRAFEKGPLEAEIVARVEGIWEMVRDEAPLDHVHG